MRSFVKNRDPSIGSTLVAAAGALGATVANTAAAATAAATAAVTAEAIGHGGEIEDGEVYGNGGARGKERGENGLGDLSDRGSAVNDDCSNGLEEDGFRSEERRRAEKRKDSDENIEYRKEGEREVNKGELRQDMAESQGQKGQKNKNLSTNTGIFYGKPNGHYGPKSAEARNRGPLSLHTSDFDGYEGTETEVLTLGERCAVDCDIGGVGPEETDDTHETDNDHNEDEDGNSVSDADQGDEGDNGIDGGVLGSNSVNAAFARSKNANTNEYPKAELVEYYRQKELAEMRNGITADINITSSRNNYDNKTTKAKTGNAAIEQRTNHNTLPALHAVNLFQADRDGSADGLLDSYPSTTVLGTDDFDDGVVSRGIQRHFDTNGGEFINDNGEEMHGGNEEAGEEVGNDNTGEDEENGSYDAEQEVGQQHVQQYPDKQGSQHQSGRSKVQQSPLRGHDKRRGGNISGSKTVGPYTSMPAALVSGHVQGSNRGQHHVGFIDHTYNDSYGISNDLQMAGQTHPDMTALIQRAGRSKFGIIKTGGSQIKTHNWDDAAAANVVNNAIAHSSLRRTLNATNPEIERKVLSNVSQAYDKRNMNRIIPRRVLNEQAYTAHRETSTAVDGMIKGYPPAVATTKAVTGVKSKLKKGTGMTAAQHEHAAHMMLQINTLPSQQEIPTSHGREMTDGFTSAEAEEEEAEAEEDEGLDYEREKLYEMTYKDLEKEPFDWAPDAAVAVATMAKVTRQPEANPSSKSTSEASSPSSPSPSPALSPSVKDLKPSRKRSKGDHHGAQTETRKLQVKRHEPHPRDHGCDASSVNSNPEPIQTILASVPNKSASQQSSFYSSLPISDWDDAGDFLVDELAATLKQFKAARARKREVARMFEDEVGRRYGEVREEGERVGRRVKELRVGGEGLLSGGDGGGGGGNDGNDGAG